MTFNTQEGSVQNGAPIFLYSFDRGGSNIGRFSSGRDDVVYTNTFSGGTAIRHTPIKSNGNAKRDDTKIIVPRNSEVATILRTLSNSITNITISKVHTTDGANEVRVIFIGYVGQGRQQGDKVEFPCFHILNQSRKSAMSFLSGRTCRWLLYGYGCRLTQADWETNFTVSAVNGNTITLTSSPTIPSGDDNYYVAGKVRFGDYEVTIDYISGSTLYTFQYFSELAEAVASGGNQSVVLAPGCDYTIQTCDNRFDNSINHGGAAYHKDRDIFALQTIL